MKELFKKTKFHFIAASVLTIILGLILIINPVGITVFVCRAVGFILFIAGLFITGSYFLNLSENTRSISLIPGLIELTLGLWVIFRAEKFVQFLTLIFGVMLIVHSFGFFQTAFDVKHYGSRQWWIMLVISIVMLVLGIVIVISPFTTVAVALRVAGICLILDGISGIVVSIKVEHFISYVKAAANEPDVIETLGEEIE